MEFNYKYSHTPITVVTHEKASYFFTIRLSSAIG